MTFCCLVNLTNSETQKKRLESLDIRSGKIVNRSVLVITVQGYKIRHACKFVRKCLDGTFCEKFYGYFTEIEHPTQWNKCLLKISLLRTEFAKKSALFMANKFAMTCLWRQERSQFVVFLNNLFLISTFTLTLCSRFFTL